MRDDYVSRKAAIKGYKGMSSDMTCRGMKFEVGGMYIIDGEIAVCQNGLHFCERLIDVFNYYSRDGLNRFFEIEASGTVKKTGDKSAASELRIVRELTDIEINRICHGDGDGDGYGYGYGDGDGYGYGYGDGDGYGYGYGDGDGYGYGYGYGDGDGDGYGDGIQSILLFV